MGSGKAESEIFEDVQRGLLARPQRAKERGVLLYVHRASERRENAARSLFQHPTERGATGFDGDTDAIGACRALGDSYNSGKMQLPIKNWHSQLN